ncbi:meiosis 1 arrest protein [Latimeria chalumnae]|uniref:Meiosis 1 associated protein n=1 Tax=Latimeria chalumnae TaxID=7897 RepID=M3XLN2_LATCH
MYPRQVPRLLVVDAAPPYWQESCPNLCEALENFFSLACSLLGPSRAPLLSVYMVQNQHECLLPFVQMKGNFLKLHTCVTELRSIPKEGCIRQKPDCLKHAVEDGLLQFKQYMRHVTAAGPLSSSSLEITILTSQPGKQVVKQLESGLSGTDLVSLRRLQVVHITRSNLTDMTDLEWNTQTSSGERAELDENSILGTDIDLQTIENEVVCLENFFKAWLQDHGTDKEHLHLFLPSGCLSSSAVTKKSLMCLKCDVQDRLLNPTQLPGTADASIKTDSARDFQSSKKTIVNQSALLYKLRVIKALKSDGVCESVFYGLPLIIRPTSCWQLDWDELETNHQSFHALCHALLKRDWMLLVRSEPLSTGHSWNITVNSYYVILPSASLTLLLKPVAVRELLLPCDLPTLSENPQEVALRKVESALDSLDIEPIYNPLTIQNNLYKHLRGLLSRNVHRQQVQPAQRKEQRPKEPPQPRQLQSRQYQNKVKAAVAPLPMTHPPANQPKSFRPALAMNSCYDLTLFSDDDEFLTGL